MSPAGPQPDRLFPEDHLPEVRPPSAGFIVQLFVIPAVVVSMIVLVWLCFGWLAHMGGDPASYLREMKQNNANSWQQADNLAEALHSSEAVRHDAGLAKELAQFLGELLSEPLPKPAARDGASGDEPSTQRDLRSEQIERRIYVCKALGEFYVADDALPALLRAAAMRGDGDESKVRLAALEGIAVLAENVRATKPLSDPLLIPTLVAASRDEQPIIVKAGTFALGVVGGPEAIARLEKMLREPHEADVHYNAATGLARHGDPAGLAVIQEMIDPASTRGLMGEEEADRPAKRNLLQRNGLHAAEQLSAHNARVDLAPLMATIKKLASSDAPPQIKSEAAITLRELSARTGGK